MIKKTTAEYNQSSGLSVSKVVSIAVLAILIFSMMTGFVIGSEDTVDEKTEEEIGKESIEANIDSGGGGELHSVTIQPGETPSKDTWIRNGTNEHINNGEDNELTVGNAAGNEYRSLIKYDLPKDIGELQYASLQLYASDHYQHANISIHGLSKSWDEGTGDYTPNMAVNWTHRTDNDMWGNLGGDYWGNPHSYRRVDMENLWYSWDVTEIVEYWVSGTKDNHGFILKPSEYVSGSYWAQFYSSNSTDPSLYPKLVLSYAPFPDMNMEMNDPPQVTNLDEKDYGPVEHISGTFDGSNSHPFTGTIADSFHYQTLYTPNQVGSSGRITRLSVRRTDMDVGNFSNLEISLAHTTLDNLTTTFSNNYHGELIEVFSADNMELNSSDNDPWVDFDLNDDFIYDTSYNLVVDITWNGDGDTSVFTSVTQETGTKRVWSIDGGSPSGDHRKTVYRFTTEVLHDSVIDAGTQVNTIPFWPTRDYYKAQMLFNSSELSNRQGIIDILSFYRTTTTTGEATFPDLTFNLAHTTLESLTDTYEDNYYGDLTEVLNVPSFTFESGYGWVDIDIDNTFNYNGQDNLLLEIEWNGDADGDNIYLGTISDGSLGERRLYSDVEGSETGDTSATRYNIRTIFQSEWEAQSMDPDLFEARVEDQELIVTPQLNARGIGTLALTMRNGYPGPLTREITVNIGMKDTFITNDPPNYYNNFGAESTMYLGGYTSDTELRGLLEFNLPQDEGVLKRASVSLYCSYIKHVGEGVNVSLSPITNQWLENDLAYEEGAANWENRTTGTPWDTPGGDFDTSYKSYRNISQNGIWYDWDITEIVRAWYDGDIDNNGLMITGDYRGPSDYNYVGFRTTDYSSEEYWPKISVTFGPEEIPDQTMQEDDPTQYVPLNPNYGVKESISGSMDTDIQLPFTSGYPECRYQALYTPSQIMAEGEMKSISLKRASSMDVGNFSDFKIYMAHTSNNSLVANHAYNYDGNLVEVYSSDNYEANSSNNDPWLTFDLNGNFTYDMDENLLVEFNWNGSGIDSVPINHSLNMPGNRRLWANDLSASTGGTDNKLLVMRFEVDMTDVSVVDSGTDLSWTGWFATRPFGSGAFPDQRYQILQNSSSLNATGAVDKIRLQSYQNGLDWAVVENLSIRMAHSTNVSLGNNFEANYIGSWVEVLNRSSYNLSSEGALEWIEIELDDPFYYDGSHNMVIDIRWKGGYASDWGLDLYVNASSNNDQTLYGGYDADTGTALPWRHNIQTIFLDNPHWEATSSDPSLFTTGVSMGPNLDITPQPDQHGSGTIDLRMMNCNGYLTDQQTVGVTITAVNDPPELSGPTTLDCVEDVDYVLDMEPYTSDIDNTIGELTFSTNSSYATVDGYNITFNYPNGVLSEVVEISVQDPDGLSDYTIVEVTVEPVNDPPVLSGVPDIECNEGEDYVLDMSPYVSDIDNDMEEL
ncbi:MAG: DNRLRE domain-containing protein, partial [Candidatus Thermoplasmatota archaeon]|nr:DNRLRE domain-containing protein [Candidatus Thermoplasmatota archaeon]